MGNHGNAAIDQVGRPTVCTWRSCAALNGAEVITDYLTEWVEGEPAAWFRLAIAAR